VVGVPSRLPNGPVWHSLEIGFTLIAIISLPNFRRCNNWRNFSGHQSVAKTNSGFSLRNILLS
jgi:hypothetical protein